MISPDGAWHTGDRLEDGSFYSVTGASAKAESQRFTKEQEKSSITAGFMWQTLNRDLGKSGLSAEVTSFVPICDENAECMYVKLVNNSDKAVTLTKHKLLEHKKMITRF